MPLELVLARTERVAVGVTSLAVYPKGFVVELWAMGSPELRHEEDDPFDDHMLTEMRRSGMRGRRGREIPPELLRVGAQFADGRKATSVGVGGGIAEDREPGSEPSGPLMISRGGGGCGRHWHQGFWFWPLPPDGALQLVCEWPAQGIELTRRAIDTAEIRAAAARAQVIFPPRRGRGGWTT